MDDDWGDELETALAAPTKAAAASTSVTPQDTPARAAAILRPPSSTLRKPPAETSSASPKPQKVKITAKTNNSDEGAVRAPPKPKKAVKATRDGWDDGDD